MPAKFSLLAVAAVPLVPVALACGGDDGGGGIKVPDAKVFNDAPPPPPDAADLCTATTDYGAVTFAGSNSQSARSQGSGSAQAIQYVGRLNADAMPDILDIELYAGYGAFMGGTNTITPKTIQLTGPETNYKDCGACVIILTDLHMMGSGVAETDIYFAKSGTLNLTSTTTNFQGTLSNVTFRKVDIGSDGTTTDKGSCSSSIGSAAMNAPITVGSATLNIEFEGEFIDGRATILRHRTF
jgi:hypothetical protein